MKLRNEKGKEEKKNPLKFGWRLTCGLVAQLLCTKVLFVSILFMRATKHDQKELISKHIVVPFISSLREIASLECKTA